MLKLSQWLSARNTQPPLHTITTQEVVIMRNHIVTKSAPKAKLNLTRRQADLFQKIILMGNRMSDALSELDRKMLLPKESAKLITKWGKLMVKLAKMLI